MNVGPPELLIILIVLVVIFGPAKLPGLARSLGQAAREFRRGTQDPDPPTQSDDEATES